MCERILHTRWVLIREWEHRWLHDRGACGCDVVFPGADYQPRATGGPWPVSYSTSGSSYHDQRFIPPAYEEDMWHSQLHASARIPGQYAAEWVCDHRVLHRTGRCKCRASFGAAKATVSENDFTPEESHVIQTYRNYETGRNPSSALDELVEALDEQTTFGQNPPDEYEEPENRLAPLARFEDGAPFPLQALAEEDTADQPPYPSRTGGENHLSQESNGNHSQYETDSPDNPSREC